MIIFLFVPQAVEITFRSDERYVIRQNNSE
jgi:hypothetical protein